MKIQFTDAQTTVVGLVAIRDTQHCRVADLVFGRDELAEQTRRLNDPGFPLPAGIVGGVRSLASSALRKNANDQVPLC